MWGCHLPKIRMAVAMSGGVDSSVAAAMLAEQGYEVVGLTMQLYADDNEKVRGSCCAGRDVYDARRVADKLGIAHYVLNYERAFKRDVIEDFAEDYANGLTPIPCVRCNQRIKFERLLNLAKDLGASALATGHYVRRLAGSSSGEGSVGLWRARDHKRDQSYFMFATTKSQLGFLRFPLGEFTDKAQVRRYAAAAGLEVAAKPDSQDICFVSGDYRRLVEALRPEAAEPGELLHVSGRVLGRHQGIAAYTVGQRRRLGVGGIKGLGEGPLYVVEIDKLRNQVVVGPKSAALQRKIRLSGLNWLGDTTGGGAELALEVKWRSAQEPIPAKVTIDGDSAEVKGRFSAVAPGQAVVFYRGERVLGGGWVGQHSMAAN